MTLSRPNNEQLAELEFIRIFSDSTVHAWFTSYFQRYKRNPKNKSGYNHCVYFYTIIFPFSYVFTQHYSSLNNQVKSLWKQGGNNNCSVSRRYHSCCKFPYTLFSVVITIIFGLLIWHIIISFWLSNKQRRAQKLVTPSSQQPVIEEVTCRFRSMWLQAIALSHEAMLSNSDENFSLWQIHGVNYAAQWIMLLKLLL